MPLPYFLTKYFWEINPQKAKPKSYPAYYIKRILELGDKKAIQWLMTTFGKKKIKETLVKVKLSPKAKNYWNLVFK